MKSFFRIICVIIICVAIFVFSGIRIKDIDSITNENTFFNVANNENISKEETNNTNNNIVEENSIILLNVENPIKTNQQLDDWRLVLVNFENPISENFKIELANIDSSRQFDARAIEELNALLKAAKDAKVGNLWVQSAYRSLEKQEELFNNKINEYMKMGKTREEAEELTRKYINESNTSEHNVGLAVDFNYINRDFEKSQAFTWLNENAEKYGFILRYRNDKVDITKVNYEPWHWRYVGVEHAQKINELDMCLEEYVEFLENNNS